MNPHLSVPKSRGLRTALLAALAITSAQAQITVDGVRDGLDTGYAEGAVQATTTNWGANNALANLHTAQDGSNLAVFLGGRSSGSAFLLFIDSKPGGFNFIPNNLINSGGEEHTINNLGTSPTAGLTFEAGFTADYAIRIYGSGSDAYINRYNLQTGIRDYVGNAGPANQGPSAFITQIRAAWADASPPYGTAINGVEMKFNLAGLGVPSGEDHPVKLMAVLVDGESDSASNQVLGSRTSSTVDIGPGINAINFETETGVQTISLTVDNTDTDGDGLINEVDTDDDNDGLLDTSETGGGTYVDATHTGSDSLLPDTDSDGVNDGLEVAGGQFGLGAGNVSNPNFPNFTTMAVPGSFTAPAWQVDGSANNLMTRKGTSLTDQYIWTLDYRFTTLGNIEYKFAANGSYVNSWGGPGGNIVSTIPATGIHTFEFNNATLVHSLTRKVFASVGEYLTAYSAGVGDDDDGDGMTGSEEYSGSLNVSGIGNTDPLNSDSDADGLSDLEDPQPLVAAPQVRNVVFQVDMTVQTAKGNFNAATGTVVVKIFSGIMNGSPDLPMTDGNSDGIYETAAIAVTGNEGVNFGNFKFFNTTPGAPNIGYEVGNDRNFALGPKDVLQTVPVPMAYFSNDSTLPQSYADWSGATGYNLAPENAPGDDADDDGLTNLQEFLFGTPPDSSTGALVTSTSGTGNIVLTWLQRTGVAGYSLLENTDLGAWFPSAIVPAAVGDQTGAPAGYTLMQATVPTTNPRTFFRVTGVDF
ncbi:MAG: hypothetical protein V4819_21000 [Verrucomicrobiota bacterium]